MKIFLIGGTGLLGPSFVEEAKALGHETICFNRRGLHPLGGSAFAGDRNDPVILRSAVLDSAPDCVVDMIPYTERQALDLAEIIREVRKPLLAASSCDIYKAYNILHRTEPPPYQSCPIAESDALRSNLSFQGKGYDKLHVEKCYFALPVDVSIFRLPAIYGWPDSSRVKEYVDQIVDQDQVTIHPDFAPWKFSRSLNKNCAYALALGLGRSGRNVYNVAEPATYGEQEWIERIGEAMNRKVKIVLDPKRELFMGADYNQSLWFSSDRIRAELGYFEKHDTMDGLKDNIRRYLADRTKSPK